MVDAFEQILREHGLQRDKLTFYAPMFEARYKLGLSPTWAERMRPLLRVWVMTPRSTS
jgi:hypothetical protein